MNRARVLVTGASGLLGRSLLDAWSARHDVVAASGTRRLPGIEGWIGDLTAPGAADALIDAARPDVVVHSAAWTDVNGCERDPGRAAAIHERASQALAAAAARIGARFFYISTQSVFDGERGHYTEADAPNPLNVYARTKLAGERIVLQTHPRALVVRLPLEGWRVDGSQTFVQWVVAGLRAGEPRQICTDWIHTPVFAHEAPAVLEALLDADMSGVRHVAAPVAVSNWDIAREIARVFGLDARCLIPIDSESLRLTAVRPKNVSLTSLYDHHPVSHPFDALQRLHAMVTHIEPTTPAHA